MIRPDDGVHLKAGPATVTLKVTADHGARFSLVDYLVGPSFAAPPQLHAHTREDWAAYVVEGELVFVLGTTEKTVGAGSIILIPAGVPFAWRNDDPERPARYLAVYAPAGFEQFFADVVADVLDQGGPSPQTMTAVIPPLWARYGVEPAH